MSIYHKTMIQLIDWHLGRKTRRLMKLKLEVETLEQKVFSLNYERQLEIELADFQRLVMDHKCALRLTGQINQKKAA